jgi:hypothetical protein
MAEKAKADRSAAAKKAAVTRERNKQKKESQEAGGRAAATRQANKAKDDVASVGRGVKSTLKSAGDAAKNAGKAVSARGKKG